MTDNQSAKPKISYATTVRELPEEWLQYVVDVEVNISVMNKPVRAGRPNNYEKTSYNEVRRSSRNLYEFIEDLNISYRSKGLDLASNLFEFTYSRYKNSHTPMVVTCKKHGCHFLQTPNKLMAKIGCPLCGKDNHEEYKRLKGLAKHHLIDNGPFNRLCDAFNHYAIYESKNVDGLLKLLEVFGVNTDAKSTSGMSYKELALSHKQKYPDLTLSFAETINLNQRVNGAYTAIVSNPETFTHKVVKLTTILDDLSL